MPSELFPIDSIQMDSPRLTWIRKHRVFTRKFTVDGVNHWLAFVDQSNDTRTPPPEEKAVMGFDEDDALANLAAREGWPLWNEEAAP